MDEIVRVNVQCEDCNAEYEFIYNSDKFIEPEYCPFCGANDSAIFYNKRIMFNEK